MQTTEELLKELQERQANYRARQGTAPSGYAPGQTAVKDSPLERKQSVPEPISNYNVEDMHEAVSYIDRWTVKNLSMSQKASIAFLEEKYPNLEFEYDGSRIYMRDKGNKEKFFVLDPSTMSMAEMVGDMGDIVADVIAGTTTAIAAVLGGLAGVLLTGDPLVGLGAGAATSGVMGASTDIVRQKLGKAAGIPQEPSTWEAFKTGLVDAAGTLIFGTGAPIKNIIRGVAKPSGKELMKKSGVRMLRGGAAERYGVPIRRAITDKIGVKGVAKLAEPLTDVSQAKYQRYVDRPDQMAEIKKTGPANYAEEKLRGAYRGIEAKEAEVSQAYNELGRPGEIVDIKDVKKGLDTAISDLEKIVKKKVELPKMHPQTKKKHNRLTKKDMVGDTTQEEKDWLDKTNAKMGEAITEGQKGSKEIQRETLKKYKALREKAFKKDVHTGVDPESGEDIFKRIPEDDYVTYDRASEIKKELTDSTGKYKEAITQTGDEASKKAEKQAKTLKRHIEKKIQDSVEGSREARDAYINTRARKQDFIERYKDKPDEYIPSDEMADIADDTYFSEKGLGKLKQMGDESPDSSVLRAKTKKIDEKAGSDLVDVGEDLAAYDVDLQEGKRVMPWGDPISGSINALTRWNIANPRAWKGGMVKGRKAVSKLRDNVIVPTDDFSVKRKALEQSILDTMLWGDSPDRSPQVDEYGNIIEYDREGRVIRRREGVVPPMSIDAQY